MNRKNPQGRLLAVLAGVLVAQASSQAAEFQKANNANALDLASSWVGNSTVPGAGDLAVYSSINTASSGTVTIGGGVSFLGISFSSNPGTNMAINAGTGGTLALGASGIDVSAGNRTLTIGSTINLTANQVWTTGSAAASTSQIVTSGRISGAGSLTINGTADFPLSPVYLNNATNDFTGGVILNSGGAIRLSSGTPTFSGNTTTGSSTGVGDLTINGGTLFGSGGSLAAPTTRITGNFAVNHATSGLNGRLTLVGGVVDLTEGIRTVSLGRFWTAAGALVPGQESLRFLQTASAPTLSVGNGTLRLARGETGTATDFVAANFGTGATFTAGAGLTIAANVITTMSTGNPFGTTAGSQPKVAVEAGGYFNMSDASNARSPVIRTLSGEGTVTNLSNSTVAGVATLTINAQSGDSETFSGSIVNGSSLNSSLGVSAGVLGSVVAVTKTGAGTQILAGTNSYTGNTTVSAGTLLINGDNSAASGAVNVSNAGTVLGGGGIIRGSTTMNSQTRLQPTGTLTFNQGLNLVGFAAVDFAGGTLSSPNLVRANTLSLSATWVLALGTGFENGGSTVIFEYTTAGTFASGYLNSTRINTDNLGFTPTGPLSLTDTGSSIVLNGLSVIPEPSTWLLMGCGLLIVFAFRRRRSPSN